MNVFQEDFRVNTFSSVFSMLGKIFKEVMLGGVLYFIFSMLSMIPLIGLLPSLDIGSLAGLDGVTDPNEIRYLLEGMLSGFRADFGPLQAILVILVVILNVIISSWYSVFVMHSFESKIKGESSIFSERLQGSFNARVLWVACFQIMVVLLFVGAIGGLIVTGMGSISLVLVLCPVISVLAIKLILTQASIVYNEHSMFKAMAYSLKKVSLLKALKYLALFVVAWIASFIALGMFGAISGLLSLVPYIGPVLNLILNFALQFCLLGLFVCLQSVLYFKTSDDLDGMDGLSLDDHLII